MFEGRRLTDRVDYPSIENSDGLSGTELLRSTRFAGLRVPAFSSAYLETLMGTACSYSPPDPQPRYTPSWPSSAATRRDLWHQSYRI
ncbi:hypothetical protein NMY22_g12253 [Coprinellus aureogranulatus]|nr:hypothetical protein NMY22_g12253 [Coprinellus aureogranulatus]